MRLTVAQSIVRFLARQYTERDGERQPLFAGMMGVFGHGNLAGIGEAMHADAQRSDGLKYVPVRNEQAMVHAAAAYAKTKNRLSTWACTTSVGPGATNLVTGAATATVNRLPVLLLPGDIFATHRSGVVLQELEHPANADWSVNDCLRPVSRYFHRIMRPEQVPDALLQAMRILTDPAETGAVTLALPQDVQAEAWEVPDGLFDERIWHVGRPHPEPGALARAASIIASAKRPLIIAGGGVRYSDATSALSDFATAFGVAVAETQAGKGSLPFDHELNLGAIGSTGTTAANEAAANADVVIGVGTRWSDFTTASRTLFTNPNVRFVNINIAGFDAVKHAGAMVVADARAALTDLASVLAEVGWPGVAEPQRSAGVVASRGSQDQITAFISERDNRTDGRISQAEAIGAVRDAVGERGIVVCAAGSLPGDLHRLWPATDSASYHVEYGFSCMGYEIAGAIGAQLAKPDRQVVAMVGDGSWLMLSSELTTAVQEQIPVTVVLIDNHGYGSIGALSTSLGSDGFGTRHRYRGDDGDLTGETLPVDYEAMARAYGAHSQTISSYAELHSAVTDSWARKSPSVIVVRTHTDGPPTPGGYWWDVPVAQVSERASVLQAGTEQKHALAQQRTYV